MTIATRRTVRSLLTAIAAALALTWGASGQARCDTPDGPALRTAHPSLDAPNVYLERGCVEKKHEAEIRGAFERAAAARKADGAGQDLADSYSLDTLVWLHRAAQRAPYAGLKLTGRTGACCGRSGQDGRNR